MWVATILAPAAAAKSSSSATGNCRDPLSGFAASPWKGDDALAARRLLLGVSDLGQRFGGAQTQHGLRPVFAFVQWLFTRAISTKPGKAWIVPIMERVFSITRTFAMPVNLSAPVAADLLAINGVRIGITEAGTAMTGAVKSAMGLGYLLSQGIGDTLRVSLAADPVEEVKVGYEILKSLELRHRGINVIACPTCGRVEIDVVRMANELEKKLGHIKTPLNVSVLGCVVNGIGEGKEADIGIAGGEGKGILFKKGKLVRKVPMEELMDTLIVEVEQLAKEKEAERNGELVASGAGDGWEPLIPQGDQPSTLGKEIPVLPHR